jgi:hypothetical protein
MRMYPCFEVAGISWERVLSEWKWLAAGAFRLLAVSAGYSPGKDPCVGGKIPGVFTESADVPDNEYGADIYEYVSFMGDIHHQLDDVADGGKVRLRVEPRTKQRHRLED